MQELSALTGEVDMKWFVSSAEASFSESETSYATTTQQNKLEGQSVKSVSSKREIRRKRTRRCCISATVWSYDVSMITLTAKKKLGLVIKSSSNTTGVCTLACVQMYSALNWCGAWNVLLVVRHRCYLKHFVMLGGQGSTPNSHPTTLHQY